MVAYATRGDVFRYGLPLGTLGMRGRVVDRATATTDLFELDGHGFETGDLLIIRAAEGGTLPAPIIQNATYYAIRLTDATFQVSSTPSGSAINLTTDGSNLVVSRPLPFDETLERYSRWVDALLVGHTVPLDAPYPTTVTAVVAELSSKKLQLLAGVTSASMTEVEASAKLEIERWAKGIPLRDERATGSANTAIAADAATTSDVRRWGSEYLP